VEWKSDKQFRVAANRQKWRGFNMVRGHIFGTYAGGYYVSTGEIAEFRHNVPYYAVWYERGTKDNYVWYSSVVSAKHPLGKLIAEAARRSKGVDYQNTPRGVYKRMMGDYVGKPSGTVAVIG